MNRITLIGYVHADVRRHGHPRFVLGARKQFLQEAFPKSKAAFADYA